MVTNIDTKDGEPTYLVCTEGHEDSEPFDSLMERQDDGSYLCKICGERYPSYAEYVRALPGKLEDFENREWGRCKSTPKISYK